MVIDVTDILLETGASKSIEHSLYLEDISWQGEPLRFMKPLSVSGNLINNGEMLLLNADVRGVVILQCGSCLERYEHNLDFSFEARLVKPSFHDSTDSFIYEGNEFQVADIVWEFLLLEIPIGRRCQEKCKGLCPKCGINRNKTTCQCINTEENDPDLALDKRLQALKDHFSTQDKEV